MWSLQPPGKLKINVGTEIVYGKMGVWERKDSSEYRYNTYQPAVLYDIGTNNLSIIGYRYPAPYATHNQHIF
jgi:hypothetical protein